jgi:D-alanyl-D-alanine carboxypeptidase/D-alanyl-D-alanine-endopeptidase (penicillin-binding protein 4)
MWPPDYSGADSEWVVTGVSDVTKRIWIRVLAVFVVVAAALAVGVTVLGTGSSKHVASVIRPALADRVPGAQLPSGTAADILPAVGTQARVPAAAALTSRLQPLITAKALGKGVSVDVLDPLTGEHLLAKDQATARTPASTAKLLTSAAALTALGAQTTLATTTVAGADPGQVILVGGGDVLLGRGPSNPALVDGRAGLTTLARRTAAALRGQGMTSVRLGLDDRLFTGPTQASGWDPTDVTYGFVAPIQALEINAGRQTSADYAPRSGDPAMAAAKVFAGLLGKQGITVSGPVRRASADPKATVLGRVESAPVADQVEFALTQSDNTVAEALGRLVAAKSGTAATFSGVGPAVLAELRTLGVPVTGAVMSDGSGLSPTSRVPPLTLTGLLALATSTDQPQLRPILSGMPVAGVSGTLAGRFATPGQQLATGIVRAKTGTLSGVSSLAGMVVDADGRLLVFAAMADRVQSTGSARKALDSVATALAACGCR